MSQVFSTPERIAILRRVIYSVDLVSVSEVAVETGLSKGLVSKYLDLLRGEGLLERSGTRYVVKEGVETRSIKIVLNLEGLASFPFDLYPFVKGVGLYGSGAKGLNTEKSDVDLWVLIGESGEEELAGLTRELRLRLGDVRPLFLTGEKLLLLRHEDSPFYYSLLQGSIAIYGEGLEAV
jgi:DNA-binding transcriptional ArsR family regulator